MKGGGSETVVMAATQNFCTPTNCHKGNLPHYLPCTPIQGFISQPYRYMYIVSIPEQRPVGVRTVSDNRKKALMLVFLETLGCYNKMRCVPDTIRPRLLSQQSYEHIV